MTISDGNCYQYVVVGARKYRQLFFYERKKKSQKPKKKKFRIGRLMKDTVNEETTQTAREGGKKIRGEPIDSFK